MKTQRLQIEKLLEEHPEYRQRKYRYTVVSILSGIEAETCQLICSLADEYRHQTEIDEVGREKEEEWKSPAQKKYEFEEKQILKQKLL